MSKASVVVAVTVLVVVAACRADEHGAVPTDVPLPPVQEDNTVVAALETPKQLPQGEVTKSREMPSAEAPATTTESTPPQSAAPATTPESTPPQATAPVESDAARCAEQGRPGHVRRLWQWLTYHPQARPGICGCCHHCVPYCHAPLYAFFPCYGSGAGGPACCCASSIPDTVPPPQTQHVGSHVRAYLHRDRAEPAPAEAAHEPPLAGAPQHPQVTAASAPGQSP